MIEGIIDLIPGVRHANPANYPTLSSVILTKDEHGEKRKENWHYRSLVGMLNFFTNSSHPELAYTVHQCERFCQDPKGIHEERLKGLLNIF